MAFHWCENLHTNVFTPRDFQVELLAAIFERNTIICLRHKSSKEFIALKLLQELSRQYRNKRKLSLYLSQDKCSIASMYAMLKYLTDLNVWEEHISLNVDLSMDAYHVCILQPLTCFEYLQCGKLNIANVHSIVLDDCHDADMYNNIRPMFKQFIWPLIGEELPKILGLAGPLHSASCALAELKAMLQTLEEHTLCQTETASDIVTVLRYCAKPNEYIVQCAPFEKDALTFVLEDLILTRIAFLKDHKYDPFEIYGSEQFMDDLKDIPDPKEEPIKLLESLLVVLHEMGPWAADRLALHLYQRIEKQKVKTPHERHYLLLGVANTGLILVHSFCEQTFQKIAQHKQIVECYSSPKVKRLLEILRLFRPEENQTQNETMRRIKNDLERVDFQKLTRSLEHSCQTVEHVEKQQLESRSIIENLDPIIKSVSTKLSKCHMNVLTMKGNIPTAKSSANKRQNHGTQNGRTRRRAYMRRQQRDHSDLADTLCAVIFCNQNHVARVLFELLLEMSHHDEQLKFLRCQYITDRVADPQTEPKEAEAEHRRQEEVLKRFRMHDCNILIGTSVLEEGIDVPKCNLVVRWDPPTTYRSYVQCKGRARAASAYHLILVAPSYEFSSENLNHSEQLNDNTHDFICRTNEKLTEDSDSADSDDSANSATEKEDSKYISNQYIFGTSIGTVKILNPEILTTKPPIVTEIPLKEVEGTIAEYETNENCRAIMELNDEKTNNPSERLINSQKKLEKKIFKCELDLDTDAELRSPTDNSLKQKYVKMNNATQEIVKQLAEYREIEKILLEKCANSEPTEEEHHFADRFTNCIKAYKPQPHLLTGASVDLNNAISLVNKYCSKLPSDTFTKLTALWRNTRTIRNGYTMYQCTLRLPINSPLKYDIVGLPMVTKVLARRMVALQTCIELHKTGELDDNLQPIGKEGFRALESDWENFELEAEDEKIVHGNLEPRPGTTKRRQYYYKRIASEFCNCRPVAGVPCYLYLLDLQLQCPIPEEQNTRGRKIYPPEDAQQGFGILTLQKIPKVSSFPIFIRSGEVKVSIVLAKERIVLDEKQISSINNFLNYTFTNVLRLQKFLMLFDPDSTENCVFIVPTINNDNSRIIDWDFLKLIEANANMMPTAVSDEVRKAQEFDPNKFQDAVVMPWYRNQDQPQYFYVAEICPQLSPLSCFPGESYRTFKHYYLLKYGLTIQNLTQPLLDVDHTSARLNFLTPRYVNRKGVALPTSSEATKRAKRENLEQKQILVPELCTVHPFPASLWRTAVCLPCILYRINGLLLADDIRRKVSADIALGSQQLEENFEWPMLDFGWSLSEVLKKSRESKNELTNKNNEALKSKENININKNNDVAKTNDCKTSGETLMENGITKTANELIIEGEKELQKNNFIEIGTWSNDMANDINMDIKSDYLDDIEEECLKYLPSNVSFCDQQLRYGSPTFWDISNNGRLHINTFEEPILSRRHNTGKASIACYSDDSFSSDYDDYNMQYSSDDDDVGRIEFTSKNEAETIETEQEIAKRNKELSIIEETNANERNYQETKNLQMGYNFINFKLKAYTHLENYVQSFLESMETLQNDILNSKMLVKFDESLTLPKKQIYEPKVCFEMAPETFKQLVPYADDQDIKDVLSNDDNVLSVEDFIKLNQLYVSKHPEEVFTVESCGDIFDKYNDHNQLHISMEESHRKQVKLIRLNFGKPNHIENTLQATELESTITNNCLDIKKSSTELSFDYQPVLEGHPGPSPSVILQALTMSNANDGINLERLETIGDSFLKYAITTYLYITYENVHEGKLSHLRSKQVANLNLYRLGRRKMLGEYMIATKFEPHDNWLPPCYYVPKELEKELIEAKIPPQHWKLVDLLHIKKLSSAEICALVREKADNLGLNGITNNISDELMPNGGCNDSIDSNDFSCFIPYNLVTQHSIPDKSIADCVEALIGAYLIECGPRGALLFMAWLGIRVLPYTEKQFHPDEERWPGTTNPAANNMITVYGTWSPPRSPLLHYAPNAQTELESLLVGFDEFEATLGYKFRDRSYLLQAMTHASYTPNRLTDCYQRLEFLGDAVLDYLITRHLYEDPRQHSPGALTDLRSALVNNTIFASLAVRHGFHKYFRHLSPGLNDVIARFVRIQEENGHSISEEYYLLSEEECDDAEDVEVPKALGDVFESIAGAIFLDSNMSLDVVWQVYSNMMKPEIEQFSNSVPKSPIRELLELEPETAKFSKPEKLADGRRVRVTVEVFCKGTFRGIGRNYRIAKCTAAKCALRQLKKQGLIAKKD